MNKALATAYQYIAPAHRAIWRADIFLLLLVPFWYLNHPDTDTSSSPIVTILLFLGLSIYHVVGEYRHPNPGELGFSAPNEARYWFAGFAVLLTALSILINGILSMPNSWLWLGVIFAGTAVAYLLRPRLSS